MILVREWKRVGEEGGEWDESGRGEEGGEWGGKWERIGGKEREEATQRPHIRNTRLELRWYFRPQVEKR
jgi:hypothetical protein